MTQAASKNGPGGDNGSRKSHTVSRSYLKCFTNDESDNKVWLLAKSGGKPKATGIKQATVETDYFRIPTQSGNDQYLEDKVFHKAENHGARVRGEIKVGDDGGLSEQQRMYYTLYLTQAISVMSRKTRTVSAGILNSLPEDERPFAVGSADEKKAVIDVGLKVSPKVFIWLWLHDWKVIKTPGSTPLITSDHQVGYWTWSLENPSPLSLFEADIIVHPLAPDKCLLLKQPNRDWPKWCANDSRDSAAEINWAIAHTAGEIIILGAGDPLREKDHIDPASSFASKSSPRPSIGVDERIDALLGVTKRFSTLIHCRNNLKPSRGWTIVAAAFSARSRSAHCFVMDAKGDHCIARDLRVPKKTAKLLSGAPQVNPCDREGFRKSMLTPSTR